VITDMKTDIGVRSELQRLATLWSCDILDSDPEFTFNTLVQAAKRVLGVPIALGHKLINDGLLAFSADWRSAVR